VLAITYKTIQPTFSKICFQLIHGSPEYIVIKQKSKGQH